MLVASPLLASLFALDNGLALTPQMGWSSWSAAGSAVNASYVQAVASYLKSSGLQALGFGYVNVDEGWMLGRNASTLAPMADARAFPDGMDGLGRAVHALGFRYGLYTSRGTTQCDTPEYRPRCLHTPPNPPSCSPTYKYGCGCEGSAGYEAVDAAWFVAQGADYLKVDSCGALHWDPTGSFSDFAKFRDALNATGKPVFFSLCGWHGWYAHAGAGLGNSWRISGDGSSWGPLSSAVNVMAALTTFTGPGGWNDPDLLSGPTCNPMTHSGQTCGNTDEQARTQFSLWCLFPAPLLISQDVLQWSGYALETYSNAAAIAVNQDKLGKAAVRLAGGNFTFPCAPAPPAVRVEACEDGNPSQQWQFIKAQGALALAGDDTRALDTGACAMHNGKRVVCATQLVPAGGGGGAAAAPSDSGGWTHRADGSIIAHDDAPGAPGGSCLGVWEGADDHALTRNNASANLFPCNQNAASQRWVLHNRTQQLINAEAGTCLTAVPAAPCTNVWGRELEAQHFAFVLVNNGPQPANVTCDAACFAQLRMPADAYQLQDLYNPVPVLPNIARDPTTGGFAYTAEVDGGGGSRFFSLAPAGEQR